MNLPEPPAGGQGFPRDHRLLSPLEFKAVFRDAKRSTDRHFVVLARTNTLTQARLGLAIAKKQLRRAVARNRVKRVVRESFRRRQPLLAGLDIVVMARPGLARIPNRALFEALDRHWKKVAALPRA